ncbi:PcfB family protein [Porcincola intestinalis]|uniref:PcfB family protein n=1 Tax=Porcincola intestinalis TaxID=2606632 RepID=A0A6L5X4Q6_9FIRM|nr:PcfB family protein [Porcincola intestinalis]MCI6767632.1 PcfB family protein [Lachnospiraceae bacterium]MDD7060508.1 PcfB family protein [Porcincola intestinalis]MDY5282529.1 PcfB family protein [Porcincola intestinalis]MSS13834.1 PcfB family protein [Porcincola intestinalis]
MQEEVNEKTIALCIRGGKITANILKAALTKLLRDMEKSRNKAQQKIAEMAQEKPEVVKRGRQSLDKMMKNGSQLTNIEITDKNIRSFERVARKYSIDYSLKKDKSAVPPKYLVFFKAKDVDVMTAAFKEYTGVTLQKVKKPSIRKRLQKAIDRAAKHREREKIKQKDRGQTL